MDNFDWDEYKKHTNPAGNFDWTQHRKEAKAKDSLSSNQPKSYNGLSGIWEEVVDSVLETPRALGNFAINLPGQAADSGKQALTNLPRSLGNLADGILEGGKGFINIPSNIAEYLNARGVGKGDIEDFIRKIHIGDTGLEKAILGEESQPGDEFLRSIGSFMPYARAGSAARGLAALAKRSGAAAAYGVGQNQNPITLALSTGLVDAGLKSLNPVRRLRGHLSAEELAANLLAARGTNTPLGRVVASPTLSKTFESVTSEIPFTGGEKSLGQVINQLKSEAANNLEITKPEGIQGDMNYGLKNALVKAFQENRKAKNEAYSERDAIANKEMFNPDLTGFNKMASDFKEGIQGSAFYSIDPVFKNLFNKVSSLEKASDVASEGKPKRLANDEMMQKGFIVSPTITESTMLARQLEENGNKLLKSTNSSDKAAGGLYMQLASQLRSDIESSIEKKGSKKLKEAHANANANYKQNYLPFLEDDLHKILNKKDSESLVAEIVQPSKRFDRFENIENVNSVLSPEESKILGHHYLSQSLDEFGNADPKKLASLIEGLGPRQFEALFPNPNVRKSLKRYSRLRGMNEEALNLMFNPKTGARNLKTLGGILGGIVAPHKAAAIFGGSALFNKLMTSPKIREALVKRMLSKEKYKFPETIQPTQDVLEGENLPSLYRK